MPPLTGVRSGRLADERGFALVMALGILVVLTIIGVSVYKYTNANVHSSRLSGGRATAWAAAEAGIDAALSILDQPATADSLSTLSSYLLPPGSCGAPDASCVPCGDSQCVKTVVSDAYALWNATLSCDPSTGCDPTKTSPYWLITSRGYVRNPDAGTPAERAVQVKVPVVPALTQPTTSPSWNYIMTTQPPTPGVCDEIIQQSVDVNSPLYVSGNLCLQNSAVITRGALDVGGALTLQNPQNTVGTSSAPITQGVHVVGGCQWQNKPLVPLCDQPSTDNVWANPAVDQTLESDVLPPVVAWGTWYLNASPGPYSPCVTSSGPVPLFDDNQGSFPDVTKMDDSLDSDGVPYFNLTPGTSYTCETPGGKLSWDASTHTLTVAGTIFIDGSAYVQNGAVNTYQGQGTLYLYGTFLEKNSKLCAKVNSAGTDCTTTGWDPNSQLLGIMAHGSGGQVNSWDSVQFVSSRFQGAVLANHDIDTDTTSQVDGPMEGEAINLGQSVNTTFPSLTILPSGFPSSTLKYAQPLPPVYLAG